MVGTYDTGMDLLIEAAATLEVAANACEEPADGAIFRSVVERIHRYLAVSRPSTTLGMPQIPSHEARLTDENVIHRSNTSEPSHVRVLPD